MDHKSKNKNKNRDWKKSIEIYSKKPIIKETSVPPNPKNKTNGRGE